MGMKRILYYGLSENPGGIETYLYKIAKHIDRTAFSLAFIDETGGKACFRKELEALGADFFDITPRRNSIFQNRCDLDQLFASERFDVLHYNVNTLSYIEPLQQAYKHGVRIILHSRNSATNTHFHTRLLHWIHKKALNKMDVKRLAVSKLAGEWLFGKDTPYRIINNGVEIERFAFSEEKRRKFRQRESLEGKKVYTNIGIFLPVKNQRMVVDIFSEIYKKDKTSVLLLVGDGPMKADVQEKVEAFNLTDCVEFMGRRNDVPDILCASDCLLFPSLYEGFPNAILEAETSGLPIVMSDQITDEVMILSNCCKKSLEEEPGSWAEMAIGLVEECNDYLRIDAAEIIRKNGFSVEEEILKLQEIYGG